MREISSPTLGMRREQCHDMLANARSASVSGVSASMVEVEVHLGKGLPGFDIVGLPEAAVRESRVRVRAALHNSGFDLPPRRVILSLAPADVKKRGAGLDLAIAVALLSASGHCAPNRLPTTLLVGELSLSGELRSARGLLPQLSGASSHGLTHAVIPHAQLADGAMVPAIDVRGAYDLRGVIAWLNDEAELPRPTGATSARVDSHAIPPPDMSEVAGQASAKRALEIAAAGNHHLLLVGPPGSGKTMLARRLPGILPPPTPAEQLEIATIASAGGLRRSGTCEPVRRPFRAPHHTASAVALVGGGSPIRPGEVTLAHRGVLFLDELPEFGRVAIESFRTLMESGRAVVARANERADMPAAPLVIGAMNPCPCGFGGEPGRICLCTPARVASYRGRISGPMLDRFDLHVAVPSVAIRTLRRSVRAEASEVVRERVTSARDRLLQDGPRRLPSARDVLEGLEPASRRLMIDAAEALGLSLRGFARVGRVATTIAALAEEEVVQPTHVAEAISFRLWDRGYEHNGPKKAETGE